MQAFFWRWGLNRDITSRVPAWRFGALFAFEVEVRRRELRLGGLGDQQEARVVVAVGVEIVRLADPVAGGAQLLDAQAHEAQLGDLGLADAVAAGPAQAVEQRVDDGESFDRSTIVVTAAVLRGRSARPS